MRFVCGKGKRAKLMMGFCRFHFGFLGLEFFWMMFMV